MRKPLLILAALEAHGHNPTLNDVLYYSGVSSNRRSLELVNSYFSENKDILKNKRNPTSLTSYKKKNRLLKESVPDLSLLLKDLILSSVLGSVQQILSTVAAVVPPMISLPFWFSSPLWCMPEVTGKYCRGTILYPITMSNFIMANVTDARMESIIDSFPTLFQARAGYQSKMIYEKCFAAYMALHCVSLFPMCFAWHFLAREETLPGLGTVPPCGILCGKVLNSCPGFKETDLSGLCDQVSFIPLCSYAVWRGEHKPDQLDMEFSESSSNSTSNDSYDDILGELNIYPKPKFQVLSKGLQQKNNLGKLIQSKSLT